MDVCTSIMTSIRFLSLRHRLRAALGAAGIIAAVASGTAAESHWRHVPRIAPVSTQPDRRAASNSDNDYVQLLATIGEPAGDY